MADFAYAYSSVELEKLDVPSLEEIFENVRTLLARKRAAQGAPTVDEAEVERINAVYDKIPADEQRVAAASSMRAMWESVKNDTW